MPETPQANSGPTPAQSQPASGGQAEAETTPVQTPFQNPPPQGEGVPRRLYTTGGPATEERLNVAIKVLRIPLLATVSAALTRAKRETGNVEPHYCIGRTALPCARISRLRWRRAMEAGGATTAALA